MQLSVFLRGQSYEHAQNKALLLLYRMIQSTVIDAVRIAMFTQVKAVLFTL